MIKISRKGLSGVNAATAFPYEAHKGLRSTVKSVVKLAHAPAVSRLCLQFGFPVKPSLSQKSRLPPSFHVHRENARPVCDQPASPNDHSPNRLPGLGVHLQRRVRHLLLHFEPARFLPGLFGDGFVNVCGHIVRHHTSPARLVAKCERGFHIFPVRLCSGRVDVLWIIGRPACTQPGHGPRSLAAGSRHGPARGKGRGRPGTDRRR